MIEGMSVEDAAQISRQALVEAIGGLPARKQHAAALAIETLQLAPVRKTPNLPTAFQITVKQGAGASA
jgi:hypothetical protein